ncbi:MAG: amidohydrolase [Geminicoccaceae bacterium]|nr:amidohydrolase [Geminicoccaceae bacterium]MCB9943903.1 amidohydrolase [Geminicoccaceae bacterium]
MTNTSSTERYRGAIDCDVHPQVPSLSVLLPYLDDYWRDMVEVRGIEGFRSHAYPPGVPASIREDWRSGPAHGADSVEAVQRDLLDHFGLSHAILNCLYGVQQVHDEGLAAALCAAVNDWIAAEWLDRDSRLRASIVVPLQNPQRAVDEIERLAPDRRFVQVLMPAMHDLPFGRRHYWPIYDTACRHDMPVGLHLGSAYRQAITAVGWPTYHVEDYVDQTQGMQAQLASLMSHGVFVEFPELRIVLIESGVSWLPAFAWRYSKFWRGLRMEVPWVDQTPFDILRRHVRLTTQPFDCPDDSDIVQRLMDHLGSNEMLLFSSDYPHWQFDGDDALPPGLPEPVSSRLLCDNPMETYPRLGGP